MGTKIEWATESWNPITGCTKVSEGCLNCYAEQIGKRFQGGFDLKFHPDRLDIPFGWKKPRTIFVCSMSDLFHKAIPTTWIEKVYDIAKECPRHRFLVLTKRSTRMKVIFNHPIREDFPDNLWLGVSAENQRTLDERLEDLLETCCPNKFISVEPLLEEVYLQPHGLQWVIVGDESGAGRRPAKLDWVRSIRDQCIEAEVSFFFKQWHGATEANELGIGRKKISMPELDGKVWNQIPK